MYQRLVILGNLGKDADLKFAPSGKAVTNFSVATTRHFKKDGEQVKETLWVKVTLWGDIGEKIINYLTKGQMVLVEGELIPSQDGNPEVWMDKDNKPHSACKMRASTIKLIGGKHEPTEKVEAPEESSEL